MFLFYNCANKNERDFFDLQRAISLITTIFFISVKTHLPEVSNHFSFKICTDWKIIGVTEEEAKSLILDVIGINSYQFAEDLDNAKEVDTNQKFH